MNCPTCQQEIKSLIWNKKHPLYYAYGESTEYKIETEKDLYWARGVMQKGIKLPISHIVRIKDNGGDWSNGQGFDTIEQAKSYCNRYEFNQ